MECWVGISSEYFSSSFGRQLGQKGHRSHWPFSDHPSAWAILGLAGEKESFFRHGLAEAKVSFAHPGLVEEIFLWVLLFPWEFQTDHHQILCSDFWAEFVTASVSVRLAEKGLAEEDFCSGLVVLTLMVAFDLTAAFFYYFEEFASYQTGQQDLGSFV